MPRQRGYDRRSRLCSLLRQIIAEELEAIGDPDLLLVSITDVEVDSDINRAVVFFSEMDLVAPRELPKEQLQEEREMLTIETLNGYSNQLRHSIAKQAHLRRTPELVFRPDESFKYSAHIEDVLRNIKK